MFQVIEAETADEAWKQAASWFGPGGQASSQSGRGGNTSEVLRAAITIRNPRDRWIPSRVPAMNPAFAIAEVIWILRGRNDAGFLTYFNRKLPRFQGTGPTFHGAYGSRLRNHFGVDQLKRAFAALSTNPNSRQVVLQIWDSRIDFPDDNGMPISADVPCNIVALLKIRNRKLEWTQIMRSNDLFRGLPHNIIQFTSIQEVLAGWLGVELGTYNHFSDSLHVYASDAALVQGMCDPVREANSDSLALPYDRSTSEFAQLSQFGDHVVQESISADGVVRAFRRLSLSQSFLNLASILAAEGLRRRESIDSMHDILSACSNQCLLGMFNRWLERTVQRNKI